MNLEALRTEFLARGFDYLSNSRAENYLNDAYLLDLAEDQDWPWLEATKEGTAPVTIEGLRAVEYVINVTQEYKLSPILRARLTDDLSVDLTIVGTPSVYYLTEGKTLNVYPANTTDTLLVRYWKVPERLSGAATPLVPERFHSLIVDGAVARAYEDGDDYELAQAAKARFDQRLQAMRESLGSLQHDGPEDYVVVEDPAALR